MPSKRALALSAAAALVVLTGLYSFTGLFGSSGPLISRVKDACVDFYEREKLGKAEFVKANDHWTKNGRIVVELAIREGSKASTYTTRLCVYDKDKGSLALPGLFNQDRWRN